MLQMPSENEFYMDGYLRKGYDKAKSVVTKDWDWVMLIDGIEGAGKSVLAFQGAKYCDSSFNIDRIAFTPDQFRKAILSASKYQAVVYDEAYTGLSSRGTMTDVNKVLVAMLAEIRQKNLFVFVVMPSFFDLDKYVAIWRSRGLIHVTVDKAYRRGYFSFYNKERKLRLYVNGKKIYSYMKPNPNFRGFFTGHYPIDETEYRRLKSEALTQYKTKDQLKDEERLPYVLKALCKHVSLRQASKELEALGLSLSNESIRLYIGKISDNRLKTNDK
jgi:hypothetical protein